MANLRAAFFAALFLFTSVSVTFAQDISLISRDGSVRLDGTLLGYDGEFYRLETIYGEMTVDGSGVRCEGPGCPNLTDFVAHMRVSGSATIGQVLMPALIEAFAARNGLRARRERQDATHFDYVLSKRTGKGADIGRFAFRVTNTDEGFADLLADEADIVMALREVRKAEVKLAEEAGLGDLSGRNRSRVLALDALVPVVAHGNPVREVSVEQLANVFAGRVTNWKALGGPDAPITLYLRDERSGLAQSVNDRLLAPVRLSLAKNTVRHSTNAALADAVSKDTLGIGIVSYSEIGDTNPLAVTGTCGFSMRADRRTIKTEDYPLTAPMFIYLPARRLPKLARDFLRYTRSDAAQIVIRRSGFVDQSPEEIPVDLQGNRLANAVMVAGPEISLETLQEMTQFLRPMTRLSTSFRFEDGSARLDAQSRSNVQQLARSLETGRYDGQELYFVGFSDGNGGAAANRAIAARRADAVRAAVIEAAETMDPDQLSLQTRAFGEALPMACDDTSWGRQVNRRVEMWLR